MGGESGEGFNYNIRHGLKKFQIIPYEAKKWKQEAFVIYYCAYGKLDPLKSPSQFLNVMTIKSSKHFAAYQKLNNANIQNNN